MPHTTQRFEFNRSLNRILARHSVNLNRLSPSITGSLLRLDGRLEHHESGAFDARDIRALIHDLESLPYRLQLQFRLDNWRVERQGNCWSVVSLEPDMAPDDPADGFIAAAMLHARLGETPAYDEDF